jgi:hypothetical protein
MNPRLKKRSSGDPSFHIGNLEKLANTKGLVYSHGGALVKPGFDI